MAGSPESPTTFEQDFAAVRSVGGWAAILVVAFTAPNLVGQTAIGLLGGSPELGLDEAATIANVYALTAPFAISVTIATIALIRGWFPSNQLGSIVVLVLIVLAGLVIGNLIYEWVFAVQLEVNYTSLADAMARAPGHPAGKLLAFVLFFVAGYYELFGAGHFFAAVVAGAFGGWAVDKLLIKRL
jgi:hypothetical protein